MQLLGHN